MSEATDGAWIRLAIGTNSVAVDPALGNLRELVLTNGGRSVVPLHTAPWVGETDELPRDLTPIERQLAGDFFCAPFGASNVDPAPAHGWTANSAWEPCGAADHSLRFKLRRPVMGARIRKTVRLSADAPLLYQEHLITGGTGGLTVAHHPMVRIATRARFSCSYKRAVLTAEAPLEPGRNRLAVGANAVSLTAVPASDGTLVDLTHLPIAARHEDFVTLVEADCCTIGWSAVVRESEDDVIFVLKDARVMPVTMLWHSNGGRDRAPWSGRHKGILGIEDGCAAGAAGHATALARNAVSAQGVPTALALAPLRTHRIAQVIGAITRPTGWRRVQDIQVEDAVCVLTGDDGTTVTLQFQADFFKKTS